MHIRIYKATPCVEVVKFQHSGVTFSSQLLFLSLAAVKKNLLLSKILQHYSNLAMVQSHASACVVKSFVKVGNLD